MFWSLARCLVNPGEAAPGGAPAALLSPNPWACPALLGLRHALRSRTTGRPQHMTPSPQPSPNILSAPCSAARTPHAFASGPQARGQCGAGWALCSLPALRQLESGGGLVLVSRGLETLPGMVSGHCRHSPRAQWGGREGEAGPGLLQPVSQQATPAAGAWGPCTIQGGDGPGP